MTGNQLSMCWIKPLLYMVVCHFTDTTINFSENDIRLLSNAQIVNSE